VRIKVIYLAPVNHWSPLAVGRLEMPVDRITKAQIIKAKQIEMAFDRPLGVLEQGAALLWKSPPDDR